MIVSGTLLLAGARPQSASMKANFTEVPHLRLLIAGVAVILLATSGIAAVMAWMPVAGDVAEVGLAPDRPPSAAGPVGAEAQISAEPTEDDAHARSKCEECGIVASTREIPGKPARTYEVTVRMQDGSNRVFLHAGPANWRAGERLILIAGANQASN